MNGFRKGAGTGKGDLSTSTGGRLLRPFLGPVHGRQGVVSGGGLSAPSNR